MGHKHFYEFGRFRIDVALSRLERAGEAIPLPPKAFDLLLFLTRNSDRVVGKSELMEWLWPNAFVEDANLTQHVYTLRKALGDRADGTPYIETMPRRGYRLAADVREVGGNTIVVSPAASLAGPTQLEGERKQATVLNCSIANAAVVAGSLGVLEMRRLTGQLHAIGQEEAMRYDGIITQREPAGFVALFGAKEVHEDDARRAILAARAVERRARQLRPSPLTDEERIAVKSGIASGPLVVSRVADADGVNYVAVGDALGTASILQQIADAHAIVISEATKRAVERQVRSESIGSVAGSNAFRVIDVMARAYPAGQTTRVLAEFIGRKRETELLDGLFAEAIAGRGQVVGVVGEPGMGKSRLVHEATQSMTRDSATRTILEGRCVSYGSLAPYLPLIDLLRSYCNLVETDSPEMMQRTVERTIRDNGVPTDAGTWLLRLLGIVDEATARDVLSPEAIKARTFDALRRLFLNAAARRPLIIVVEDVHWIDRTSEEFLGTLVGQMVASRILLITTYRPGYRPPWIDRSYVTQITIAPLSADDSARLIESVAGERKIEGEVSAAILRRGEGNPFFLEELARSVLEQGADAPPIPDTVQGVIMARLDRLSDIPKALLQTAAVIGREVPLRVLARVWEGPREFAREMAELCWQEFLYERAPADEPIYVFKHALTQDVGYDSLLARRRRELHLATARALEDIHAERLDDVAATLAYHYARTDLVDEAVTWLMRAADQAARVYANAEAILHLDLAARRLQRLPEGVDRDRRMLEVALRYAHSLYFLGRFRDSVDVLSPHAARVARLNDAALAARYSFWLAHMSSRLGDQRRAAEHAHRAIDAATAAGDAATLGKAHGLLALEGHWSGNTSDGIAHGETAVELLRPLTDQQWWLGMAYFYLAINHLLTGAFDTARQAAADADLVGKKIGDPRLQTYAGYTIGWIELTRGNTEAAVAACRTSLQGAPDRVSRAYASLFLSYALLEHGDDEDARQRLDAALKELEAFAIPQWHSLAVILMGEAERRAGRLEEAARLIACGREIAARANYRYAIDLADTIMSRTGRTQRDG